MKEPKREFVVALVVLYKKDIHESETLESLRLLPDETKERLRVVIWDNSPTPLPEEALNYFQRELKKSIDYIHTKKNIPLSIIYNRTIEKYIFSLGIILLDQDSKFDFSYFTLALDAFEDNPTINLFLPIVKHGDQIVSPGDFELVKGRYWSSLLLGKVTSKNRVAIASGMLLRMSFLKNSGLRFNELLRLYNIDTDFVLRYAKENDYFFVFAYELEHSISTFENETIDKTLMRFKDFRRSLCIMNSNRGFGYKILGAMYAIYLSIKNFFIYFDVRFLF